MAWWSNWQRQIPPQRILPMEQPAKPLSNVQKGGAIGGAVALILAAIYANEGGFVDHPSDPGGATRYGVTERVARAAGYTGNMRHFPKHCLGPETACADEIYIEKYMKAPGYWPLIEIDPPVAKELIDSGVNFGPPRPSKWFQISINELCGTTLAVDGKVGPATVKAYSDCRSNLGPRACVTMLDKLDGRQRAEYDRLVRVNPKLKVFHKGWVKHRIGNVDRRECV